RSFSATSLNLSAPWPLGVDSATTWLNLITMGDCASAGIENDSAAAPARIHPVNFMSCSPPGVIQWSPIPPRRDTPDSPDGPLGRPSGNGRAGGTISASAPVRQATTTCRNAAQESQES